MPEEGTINFLSNKPLREKEMSGVPAAVWAWEGKGVLMTILREHA